MKKIMWMGFVSGIVMLILTLLVGFLVMAIPSVAADYKNPDIKRPMQDPLMTLFYVYPFLFGGILAWVWERSKTLFGGSIWQKGTRFGLAMFLITTVPGMFITYACMPYSFMTVVSWTVQGLLSTLAAGWMFARMSK